MAALLKHWREAATLILVSKGRSRGHAAAKTLFNYEILMLKRSSKSKFMPSLYVFPGGVASDADFSREWLDIFKSSDLNSMYQFWTRGGNGPSMFSRKRDPEFEHVSSDLAFRICAIRETFEESGVLLVRNLENLQTNMSMQNPLYGNFSKLPASVIEQWRGKVDKDAGQFITMCKELKIVPDVWSLSEWSNWLTPIRMRTTGHAPQARRYDTAFYLCIVEEIPPAMHDNSETVHSQWSSPDDVIKSYINSEGELAPPQIIEICRLLHFNDADALNTFNWKRSALRVDRYYPIPVICKNGLIYLYPGDDMYPAEPDFEGQNGLPVIEETVEENCARCHNKNRITATGDRFVPPPMKDGELMVNIKLKDGHLPPRTDLAFIGLPGARL